MPRIVKKEGGYKKTTVKGRKGNVKKIKTKYKSEKTGATEKTKIKVKKYDPAQQIASEATFKAKNLDGSKTKQKGVYGKIKLSDDDQFVENSPLPMRKDLEKNSAAMMKVKNPQKKY